MTTKNTDSVIDINDVAISAGFEEELGSMFSELECTSSYETEDGKYTICSAEQEGGEGEGENYHVVLLIKDKKLGCEEYWMHTAFYSSWEGTDWSEGDCFQVQEVEKTIFVYEAVK